MFEPLKIKRAALAVLAATLTAATTPGALAAPQKTSETAREAAGLEAFEGVWAPEHRARGGPRPQGARAQDSRPQDSRSQDSLPLGSPPLGSPPLGPPGQGRRPGPPPGGPRGMEISAEDQAKGLDVGDIHTRSIMTAAGKAKFATYDPLDHPESQCRSAGLPSIAMIPELQQWSVSGATLTIRHESHAVRRTVHLDQSAHPDIAHTVEGHAIGVVSGGTLTIETADLAETWGGLGRAAPGSDARVITETYRLVDADTIEGTIEVRDPKFLTRTLRLPVTLKRQPEGTEIVDFPCDIEVAQRDYEYIKAGNPTK